MAGFGGSLGDGRSLATYLNLYRDTSTDAEKSIDGKSLFAIGDELVIDIRFIK